MSEISELVKKVVTCIIDDTENFQIREEDNEKGKLFEITVSKDDVGKLIGRGGRVAAALRTITKAAGAKQGIRVMINVVNTPLEA